MNFGEAIQAMKDGKRVCRKGWENKWLAINNLKCDDSLFVYCGKDNSFDEYPAWYPSQDEMLAEDWEIKTDPPKRNISSDGLLYLSLLMFFFALEQSKSE